MIAEFVDLFMAAKPQLESLFLQGHPKDSLEEFPIEDYFKQDGHNGLL